MRVRDVFSAADEINTLVGTAAALFRVPVEDLLSHRRGQRAVDARHCVALCLRYRGLSLPKIGRVLDRDHTTIRYAIGRVEDDPILWALAMSVHRQTHEYAIAYVNGVVGAREAV